MGSLARILQWVGLLCCAVLCCVILCYAVLHGAVLPPTLLLSLYVHSTIHRFSPLTPCFSLPSIILSSQPSEKARMAHLESGRDILAVRPLSGTARDTPTAEENPGEDGTVGEGNMLSACLYIGIFVCLCDLLLTARPLLFH
jgi:hypothetical protein